MRFHPLALISSCVLAAACGTAPLDESGGDVLRTADEDPADDSLRELANVAPGVGDFGRRGGAFVVPADVRVRGRSITSWTTSWYRWHFSVPADKSPILHLDQDCATEQDDRIFFVPTFDGSQVFARTCRVRFGKPVLVPLWAVVNDYPCPDPTFQPAPGQSLEEFLREGAVSFNDGVRDLAVTVDGESVSTADHRHTTRLFHFVGDPSLVGQIPDPCLVGGIKQPAVADGWWLMLLLARGEHVVRATGLGPDGTAFDAKYRLKVDRF